MNTTTKSKKTTQTIQPTHTTPEGPKLILVRSEKSSFDIELMDSVQARIMERIPELDPSVSHTVKQMCGKDFWKLLSKGDRNKAGACVSYLVSLHKLPLVYVGQTDSYSNKYLLK